MVCTRICVCWGMEMAPEHPAFCCCLLPALNRGFPKRFSNSNEWEGQWDVPCTLYVCMDVYTYTYTEKSRQRPCMYVCRCLCLFMPIDTHQYEPEVILQNDFCSLLAELLFYLFLCSFFFPRQPPRHKSFQRRVLHFGLDGRVMRDLCRAPSGGENQRNS